MVRCLEHENGPIMLVADDLPIAMLAGDLTSLSVEDVAVTVAGRQAEDAQVAVIFRSAALDIIRDVAPDEMVGDPVPGWTFQAHSTCLESGDGGIALKVLAEDGSDGHDVRIWIMDRRSIGSRVAIPPGAGGERQQDNRSAVTPRLQAARYRMSDPFPGQGRPT